MRPIFISLLLLFTACAAKPLKKETGLTQSDFWQSQKERRQLLVMADGKAKVRLEEKGSSISGNGRILMQSSNAIKMELRDMFGRLHFSAFKKDKTFTAFFPNQKTAYIDNEGGLLYLTQKLGISIPFDQVLDLWLGRLPEYLNLSPFQNWHWDAIEGNYVGTISSNNVLVECHIEGDLGVLKKVVWLKPLPAFQVIYDDIGECCGDKKNSDKIDLAYYSKMEVLKGNEKVEVEWEDLLTSAKLPRTFDIELPKETEMVFLKP